MPKGIGYGKKKSKKNPYKPMKSADAKPKKGPSPGTKSAPTKTASATKAKKKPISKARKKTAAALKAFGKTMEKADPMSAVTESEMIAALGSQKVGAMKGASAAEYNAARKKLRANKFKNEKEYRKNN